MSKPSVQEIIDTIVQRIVERFDPEKIILFGSQAQGTAGPDSDIDILVVMPFQGSKREKCIEIRMALHDIVFPKDILVVTPDEYEIYRKLPGWVIHAETREGKLLYESVRSKSLLAKKMD